MKKFRLALATTAVAAFAMTNVVVAVPINVRPVAPALANLGSLDITLNNSIATGGIHVSGPATANVLAPSTAAQFTNTSGGPTATFVIELATFAGNNKFGIYDAGSLSQAQIFAGADTVGNKATLTMQAGGNVNVLVQNTSTNAIVSNVTYGGFSENPFNFGFYIDVPDTGATYYSEDDLNPNGDAQALIYQGNGTTVIDPDAQKIGGNGPIASGPFGVEEWIIAFEDLQFSTGDKDFNDLVVLVQSVVPIPAPAALLLGAMGLGMVGWVRKRVK